MLAGIGTYELLIVLGIVILLFGARRLPELGKSLGDGIREFRKSTRNLAQDEKKEPEEPAGEGPKP
jgi:sec-independent protein translocase protein TatA